MTVTDDEGEEFPSLEHAKAHGAIVASELTRNSGNTVAVFVVSEDGALTEVPSLPEA